MRRLETMRELRGVVIVAWAALLSSIVPGAAADPSFSEVERGLYLVNAGDCGSCHTREGGKPMAGNRPLPTPFGTIYSPNLTPDVATGIGGWSFEDFYRAMHEGIGPGGRHYYPAFPYPWFTRLSRDDVHAIKAYFDSLQPVHSETKPPELPWPLNWRGVMRAWNYLFFSEGMLRPDAGKSAEWNRGAYLVEALGHCSACHSPLNIFGAPKETSQKFAGGSAEGWSAPRLTADRREGLGRWSADDIVEYLKTGSNRFAVASGPMRDVVERLQTLHDTDLKAIAVYLKDFSSPDARDQAPLTGDARLAAGEAIFTDDCAGCHGSQGRGLPSAFPDLVGDAIVQGHDPTSLVRMVLEGSSSPKTAAKPTGLAMPGFGWKLTNSDVASLATYLRNSWGNAAAPVSASAVAAVRHSLEETKVH